MTRQFLRKVRVTLGKSGGIVVGERPPDDGKEPLTIRFSVEANISGTPNKGWVEIVNLNKDHRNSVGNEWDWLRVEAGYTGTLHGEGTVATIGEGFIRDVQHIRDRTDIVTHIEFGDGDKAWREGTISETVDGSPRDAVEKIAEAMPEVEQGTLLGVPTEPYRRPVVLYGAVAREMNKLSRSHDFRWSIQNGVLETIPKDGYIDEEAVIAPSTGMIGVPTLTDEGIKVAALLNPKVRPNRVIRVISETLEMNTGESEGRFRVDRATYSGSNHPEGDFRVDIEGTRI